jgi:hypothetical protein
MLILNLKEEKKKKSFFGQIQKSYTLDVSSFVCEKVVFNVVKLSIEDLGNREVVSLLNRYKGLVLDTKNAEVNKKISNYLFDGQLYYKRAVVSSLASKLRFYESPVLCVLDDNFRFSSEWIDVAQKCKNIITRVIRRKNYFSKFTGSNIVEIQAESDGYKIRGSVGKERNVFYRGQNLLAKCFTKCKSYNY